MKQSLLRKVCGLLLLLLAVGIPAGVITAMGSRQEEALAGSVDLRTREGQELILYNAKGESLGELRGDSQGLCTTGDLPQGEYYVAWSGGMVYFSLGEEGLQDYGGRAEAEGAYCLRLQQPCQGSVRLRAQARGQWYTYELSSGDKRYKQELTCTVGESLSCVFSHIPLGKYRVEENGRLLCTVEVTEEKPLVSLELP